MRFNGLTKGFFIFILALVTWAFFDVLSPYFSAILWAAILTVIFNPVKNRLRTALGDRNGLASLLTIGIICLIVFIPLMVILSSLAIELNVVYTKLQENNTQFPEVVASIFNHLPDWASGFLADHNLTNAAQIQKNSLMSPCRRAVSRRQRVSDWQGHVWLCDKLRHHALSAVLPAERRPVSGAPDPRLPAAV